MPYPDIRDYAIEYELDDEQREGLYYVLDMLDVWYLDKRIKSIKAKSKSKPTKGGKSK